MSLAINTTTPSGIVLAADSRQSYRNRKGQARIGSDNVSKLFQLSQRVGIAVAGLAFLPEDGVPKNISNFVEKFKRIEEVERITVKEITTKLYNFFEEKYDYKNPLKQLQEKIIQDLKQRGYELLDDFQEEKGIIKFRFRDNTGKENEGRGGVEKISISVAGYNHDGSHAVFTCDIPGEIKHRRSSEKKGGEYGADWIGQTDVTSRIVLGWDPRIFSLPFVKETVENSGKEQVERQLRRLEYQISWGTMTLQNAIDFCTLVIKTTEAIQRFSDGITMDPGDIPGVGGEIDVAVITHDKGFIWVKKKNLQIDGREIDLNQFENLK